MKPKEPEDIDLRIDDLVDCVENIDTLLEKLCYDPGLPEHVLNGVNEIDTETSVVLNKINNIRTEIDALREWGRYWKDRCEELENENKNT